MLKKIVAATLGVALAFPLAALTACGETDTPPEQQQPTVSYSDYGAVGDGKTDDFAAIKAAHEDANAKGYKVVADEGATYYIGAHDSAAVVKTDTDWGNATFIIDDTHVDKERGTYIFEVSPDTAGKKVSVPKGMKVTAGQSNLGVTFDSDVLLQIKNSNKKDYIRYGKNTNDGSDRQEILLVDREGNVSADTPVLWDYDEVTAMTAYSVDEKAVTVQGGTFYTWANTVAVSANYYSRGILVKRSNTVLDGIQHYVQGEGEQGSPYRGFYFIQYANNVTVQNCVLTGHKTYINHKDTGDVSQGTYDTQAANCNDVKWIDCTQSNPVTDTTYWGVMASNFCKNLKMEGCNLSRFDAHQGVYNATIRDTVLGQALTIIGAGTLLIENVQRLSGDHFLELRQDYGSTWEGDIIFRDCTLTTTSSSAYAIQANWQDWDFGYTCHMPTKVTLENFAIEGASKKYVFTKITSSSADAVSKSKNPYVITREVELINCPAALTLTANTSQLLSSVKLTVGT